jgi:hypothetical protein
MANIPVERRGTSMWWLWLLLGVLAIGLLVWLLWAAMNDGDGAAPGAAGGATGQAANVTLNEYTSNPGRYYGRPITVSGEVTDVESLNAFELGGEVLVISQQPLRDQQGNPIDPSAAQPDRVQVTGTAREFDLVAFERDLQLNLDDGKFNRWDNRPAIVASSVRFQ